MLEELLAAGHSGAEYDAWLVNIGNGDQFGSGFVAINPNSKIPALLDRSEKKPVPRVRIRGHPHVSGAEKFGALADRPARGPNVCPGCSGRWAGSYLGGGFGHFYAYAPMKIEYAIDRFAMEVKRQMDVPRSQAGGIRIYRRPRLHDRRHCDPGLVMAGW